MATFGRYETTRELHRTGSVVVYAGRSAAGPAEQFVIKALQPLAPFSDEKQLERKSALFISRALTQQKVADSSAQHWAPILQYGTTTKGAFYATDNYDRSLQMLIDGHVKLTSEALHTIIESITKGLLELKQACNRPHGNLKATNVLIAGNRSISNSKIVLADPSPDEFIDAKHWADDLRAIAKLIYQLIMHRPTPAVSGWQIPDSEKWTGLGRQANDWKKLCNRLLNIHVEPAPMTIENLIEELAQLKKAKSSLKATLPTTAAVFLILGIIILSVPSTRRYIHDLIWPPPSETDWKLVCDEYISWVGDYRLELEKEGKDGLKIKVSWSKDPVLCKIVEMIEIASYPDEIARREGTIVSDPYILKNPQFAKQNKTQEALDAINNIKSFFDPDSDKPWPVLADMNDIANDFKKRDWFGPATYLKDLIGKVKTGPNNKDSIKNVDIILKLQRDLDGIESQWTKIEENQKIIESTGDPILAKFPNHIQYVQSKLISADLDILIRELKEVSSLANKLAEFTKDNWTDVDKEPFKRDRDYQDLASTISPNNSTFEKWLNLAQKYLEKPHAWLIAVLQREIVESQAVRKTWLDYRDKILDEDTRDKLTKDDRPTLNRVRPKAEEAWKRLNKLNDLAKSSDRDFAATLPSPENRDISNVELQNSYHQEREKIFQNIISQFPKDEIPDINNPQSFKPQWHDDLNILRKLGVDLNTLVKAFCKVHENFKLCYLLDHQPTADSVGEFKKLYNELGRANVFLDIFAGNSSVNRAFQELNARITTLKAIQQQNQRQELVKIADTTTQTEAVFAVWSRLSELSEPFWPNKPEEWQTDKEIQDRLKVEFETIKADNIERGESLLKTLADTSTKREIIFRKANIDRYKIEISTHSFADKILVEFKAHIPYGSNPNLDEVKDFEDLAKDIMVFVTDPNWPVGFRTDLLKKTSTYEKVTLTKEDFRSWIKEAENYRKLGDDPRNKYSWDTEITYIEREINNELVRKQKQEQLQELKSLKKDFDEIKSDINDMLQLPAIKKYEEKIVTIKKDGEEIGRCKHYWEELQAIKNKLKPEYCKRLDLVNWRLVFDAAYLDPSLFEPIDENHKIVTVPGWNEIRQAIVKEQKDWLDFFYTVDPNDGWNVGWPKYVRSTKDNSVIFRFIPGDTIQNTKPFYMAICEITNEQYVRFLNQDRQTGAALSFGEITGKNGAVLIVPSSSFHPYCSPIEHNSGIFQINKTSKAKDDNPVVWITYQGAIAYTRWLSIELPTAAQHKYACKYNTTRNAHIRSAAWLKEAKNYNTKCGIKIPKPFPPVGAVEEDLMPIAEGEYWPRINVQDFDADNPYETAWPCKTNDDGNIYGLHDLIGNVWEWCSKNDSSVLCGGSCLSPPKYTNPDSEHSFDEEQSCCDIGFRVVLNLLQSK